MENYRLKVSELDTATDVNLLRSALLLATGTIKDEPNAPLFSFKIDLLDPDCPITGTPAFVSMKEGILQEVATQISSKVDKVAGKGLSSEDFTAAYKAMLDNPSSFAITKVDTAQFNLLDGTISIKDRGIAIAKIATSSNAKFVSDTEKGIWNSKEPALTGDKLAAVTSGITAAKVAMYDNYPTLLEDKQDLLTGVQLNAVNSGITAELVDKFNYYATQISQKQDQLTTAQLEAVDSGITADKIRIYDDYDRRIIEARYFTPTQQAALDSGVDSTKVLQYDAAVLKVGQNTTAIENHTTNGTIHVTEADKATWNAKQNALSAAQQAAINSGVTVAKLTDFEDHVGNAEIHVSASDRTTWNSKQAALSNAQLAAVNSGVTSSLLSSIQSTLSDKQDRLVFNPNHFVVSGTNISINTENIALTEDVIAAISSIYNFKGSCTYAELPVSTPSNPVKLGDAWQVTDAHDGNPPGTTYVWNGSAWMPGSTLVNLTAYLKTADAALVYATKTELSNHVDDSSVHVSSSDRTSWDAKQNALTTAQLAAVNSGITVAKVTIYDGLIEGKQNALSAVQLAAVNSGVNVDKIATYDNYITLINAKQDKLSEESALESGLYKITTNNLGQVIAGSTAYATDMKMSSADSTTVSQKITTIESLIVDSVTALGRIIG